MRLERDSIPLDKEFPFQISEVELNLPTVIREPGIGTAILRSPGFWKERETISSMDRNIPWKRMILSFSIM